MNTLKGKLVMSYTIISLVIVVSLSVLFNLSIDKIFEQYAINQHKKQIDKIITQINQQFLKDSGLYNIEGLAIIANAALQNGIMVHIRTTNNEIDWDIQQHNAKECQILLQHAETNMHSRYPIFQGGYAEDTYDMKYGDKLVGYLIVGYYGPYSLNDNELLLINTLNRTLVFLGAFFLVVAVIIGFFMAQRISTPISSVIRISKRIAEGNYGTKAAEPPTTRETADLVNSINEMSQTLAYKEQQKKQITADVAHELRTPLFNLQGNMEAMIDQVLEPSSERLQNCHAEILRLTQIVEQLHELNLLENKQTILSKEIFDFSNLCTSLFTDFEITAKTKGVKLLKSVQIPAPVYGDITRIKQCMINLISNAIKHTAAGGYICVEYDQSSNGVTLRVHDSGSGISQEDLPHVFERLYRVDKSRSHISEGKGIGLSITKAIVEAHGGTVSVESRVESGSTFTINLPNINI